MNVVIVMLKNFRLGHYISLTMYLVLTGIRNFSWHLFWEKLSAYALIQ